MNSLVEHTDPEKHSTLTFSQEAYNNVVNVLGFLDTSLLKNIMILYASINEYNKNKELFRAAMIELIMRPNELEALKETYATSRDAGEAKIKSVAEECLPNLETVIDSFLQKRHYFLY